jgi:hypothetical protein
VALPSAITAAIHNIFNTDGHAACDVGRLIASPILSQHAASEALRRLASGMYIGRFLLRHACPHVPPQRSVIHNYAG